MKKMITGGHTLSAMFKVNNIQLLRNVMAAVVSRGGTLIEIPYILCSIGWDHVGTLAKKMGIGEISFCHLWPKAPDGTFPCGNPHGTPEQIEQCFTTMNGLFDAAEKVRNCGVTVRFIDGPTWGVLGHKHELEGEMLRQSVIAFLRRLATECAKHTMMLAVEPLRRNPEDLVTDGTIATISTLQAVNHPNARLHLDLFHCIENGEDPLEMLRASRDWAVYLHLHGAGRRAPGAWGNKVDWVEASNIIHSFSSGVDDIPGLPEPFGKRTCRENKELGRGLPPMGPLAKYYDCTFRTFEEVGLKNGA